VSPDYAFNWQVSLLPAQAVELSRSTDRNDLLSLYRLRRENLERDPEPDTMWVTKRMAVASIDTARYATHAPVHQRVMLGKDVPASRMSDHASA
jgi:hypothetical protein